MRTKKAAKVHTLTMLPHLSAFKISQPNLSHLRLDQLRPVPVRHAGPTRLVFFFGGGGGEFWGVTQQTGLGKRLREMRSFPFPARCALLLKLARPKPQRV